MTTANTVPARSANMTATCYVTFGSNWIEVQSQKTGNTQRLEVGPCSDLSWLSYEEQMFLRKLTNDPNADSDVVLTYAQMAMFKACCEKLTTRQAEEEGKVNEEVEEIIKGLDPEMRKREALIRSLRSSSQDKTPLYKVSYYIPAIVSAPVVNNGKGKFANLANRMRGYGLVAFDGSTYYGKEVSKPEDVFKEMDEWNSLPEVAATQFLPKRFRLLVKYEWEQIHPDEMNRKRDMAFQHLRDHVVELHLSLLDNIDTAGKRLDETIKTLEAKKEVTNKTMLAARQKQVSNVYSAVNAARNNLADAVKAAQLFDETESLEPLFKGLRAAIKSNDAALIALKRAVKK